MAKYQHETCRRCERYYNTADSDYCTECLETHPFWAPELGCGDLGCTRSHDDTTTH
jgi:hypothetical protein